MLDKNSISDAKFRDLLFKECSKSDSKGHLKTNFYDFIRTDFKIMKQRAFNLHDKYYIEWQNLNNKATDEQTIESAKDSLKSGIKSKDERVLNLQRQIDDMQADLDNGMVSMIIGKRDPKVIEIDIPPTDKAYIRGMIRTCQAEISKIQGDYAPTKVDTTITGAKITIE